MKGRSHIGANVFSAIVVNNFFHVVDKVYSWHQIVQISNSPALDTALQSPQFLHKLTFYGIVALAARFPDIDQRVRWIGRLAGGHRGCTHSILSVVLLVLFALVLTICIPAFLLSHKIIISYLLLDEGGVVLKGVIVGWILHLLADSLTRAGIPIFWPVTTRLGFPPIGALRFKVGTIVEDMVLWGIIFSVGFGIGAGIIGL
jgi:inner membrane protein